jgi:ATP-dependent helicase HrpB
MRSLPIDALLPGILAALGKAPSLVLEAPPGAGKTTRVPIALLESELLDGSMEVVVTEPRRLAARLAAQRVADEHSEQLGRRVGYSVRFEDVSGPQTRLRYVTEGVLLRRLLADPNLCGIGAVVLDEFHERNLSSDLLLTLLHQLQRTRRQALKLVVMSATLDAEPVVKLLGECPWVRSEGRLYPVDIEHANAPDDRPLEKRVVSACRHMLGKQATGDILVFLPGAAEIRRCRTMLGSLAEQHDLLVVPLHGELGIAEQAAAIEPATRRKVVLSTNIAESSLTIEGVTAVIDSGLERRASYSPFTGLPRVVTEKVSRASAIQRAGRAGRTAPGTVFRLYTRSDFETRPERTPPELLRADLAELCLLLAAHGYDDPQKLKWLDRPPDSAIQAARELLVKLAALDAAGFITPLGRRLLDFPVHVRLARLIAEGERRGVARDAALAAALLAERDIRLQARADLGSNVHRAHIDAPSGPSDVLELMDRFWEAESAGFSPRQLGSMGLDTRAVRSVARAGVKLSKIASDTLAGPTGNEERERALLLCILSGFVDRLARRRARGSAELTLSTGATARLADSSVVRDSLLMVAVDVEDRSSGMSRAVTVRLASAVEPEWLLDYFSELLDAAEELEWNPVRERVERLDRIRLGSVVLEESRTAAGRSQEAGRLLAAAALAAGTSRFPGLDSLDGFAARFGLLAQALPEESLMAPPADFRNSMLERAALERTSFAELESVDWQSIAMSRLTPAEQRLLREQAPEKIVLPGGRPLVVHYELDKRPWVMSRLQDFFGMDRTPHVCRGRIALTLHLLAPNQRAVQVTSDLEGFWQRHYPSIRRELMRKYPKHAWPEDGRRATPPAPRHRR